MEFGRGLRADAEEVAAYERWRDNYARDPDRCRSYERTRRESLNKLLSYRADERMVCRALHDLPAGARILDLPCGGGRVSRFLRKRGFELVAADYSRFMLIESEASAEHRCQADVQRLPFRDRAFDAAVCFRFMQSAPMEVRIQALAELARVAARVVINYPNVYSLRGLRRFVFGGRPLTNRVSEQQVQAELESAGLEVLGFGYKPRLLYEDFVVIAQRPAQ
jgi:SAM-dependent methyltransferase